jgi:hypothetical protein
MSQVGYDFASLRAAADVPSLEPSSTTMISNVRLPFSVREVRCFIVSAIISGKRSVSLYAGTMIVRSTVLGSSSLVNGSGFDGEALERYFFSESWVIIGGGDQKTRAAYN